MKTSCHLCISAPHLPLPVVYISFQDILRYVFIYFKKISFYNNNLNLFLFEIYLKIIPKTSRQKYFFKKFFSY